MLDVAEQATIQALPKIELHRHLEGSLRLSTLVDIARQYNFEMPDYDPENIRPFVQMMPNEPRNAQHFLNKFITLRQFYRSVEVIERITYEAVVDAALDGIFYMELRFTPRALCNITDLPMKEMVSVVCNAGNRAAAEHDVQIRYIVSMNRHEPVESGESAMEAALAYQDLGVVGLDLAGDEENYDGLAFWELFKQAKEAGLGITIHAGEWAGAGSVWNAIGNLGATRIGHGINVLDDYNITQILVDKGIVLEVCPTSNVLSGVALSLEEHPLQRLDERGVLVTINTDDPLICNITLSDEMIAVSDHLNVSVDDLNRYTSQALDAAFLSDDEKRQLRAVFQKRLEAV